MGCIASKESPTAGDASEAAHTVAVTNMPKHMARDGNHKVASPSLGRYLEQNYAAIFSSNKLWITEKLAEDKKFFTNLLTASQTPDYL
jgi:hypothetical protein